MEIRNLLYLFIPVAIKGDLLCNTIPTYICNINNIQNISYQLQSSTQTVTYLKKNNFVKDTYIFVLWVVGPM